MCLQTSIYSLSYYYPPSKPKVNNEQPNYSQHCPDHQSQNIPARPFFDQ